jgi:hypothetical protein
MKRLISSALILGLLAFTGAGLTGCGEEAKVKDKETVTSPTGTTTTTTEKKVESSGSNPPPNSAGETAK